MLLCQNDQSVCFAESDPAFRRDVLNGLASANVRKGLR
jgi:hypothetical protein